jgi:hypothetical protein
MEIQKDHSPKVKSNDKDCPGFLGVFFVGILLLGITANYYVHKEAGEDRDSRSRRIAAEVSRFNH